MKRTTFLTAAWAVLAFGLAFAQEAQKNDKQLTAAQIMEKSQLAFYYQGDDMKARVTMELIGKDGVKRTRVLTMLRRDQTEGGDQKYYIYFHEPADIRRMTFMVWKYPDKEDDRWIYVPAVDLVRRIAASDARSSFAGSDFTHEDISGRDVSPDTHRLLREEKVGERDCYVIESVPKEPVDYVRWVSWIDKATLLPLREEYYDFQKELLRVFTADKIEKTAVGEGEERNGFLTVTERTMKNVKTGHRTEVSFTAVSYNIGLGDNIFTERYLRRPPRKWIK